ncbi:transcription-repair coupling factor, partial [Chloroflexota bacterium]
MELQGLLKLIDEMPAYNQLTGKLEQKSSIATAAVIDAAKPYLIAALYKRLSIPVLLVTAQPENSRKLYEQLSTWCPSAEVKLFPEPENLPYEHIASNDTTELERIQVLSALSGTEGSYTGPPIIVVSVPSLMQKVSSRGDFSSAEYGIDVGMEIEPFELLRQLQEIGYELENTVEIPGTMSHRGGIIDIYPPISDLPARLEFYGNTIDSIRLFDPSSQRSLSPV